MLEFSTVAKPMGFFYREFGKNLALARKGAKVTQEALAQTVGLSRPSIVNIEKGRQPVHLDLAIRMASTLGVHISDLLPKPTKSAASELEQDLNKASPTARPWVQKVISSVAFQQRGYEHGSQNTAGTTEGARGAPKSRNKKRSGPS